MNKPFVTRDIAVRLANEIFNLVVDVSLPSSVKEFSSYDDRNFYLRGTREGVDGEFVLRISNHEDSADKGVIDGSNEMMIFLHKKSIPCPVPQRTVTGKLVEMRQFTLTQQSRPIKRSKKENDEAELYNCAVRLLSYIDGKTMRDVSLTNDLFYKVGCFTAEVSKALKDMKCPALEARDYGWDLKNLNEAKKLSSVIKEASQKKILKTIETSFETFIKPKIDDIPKQCIHGDINEANLILRSIPDSPTKFEICGLIDFGDVNYSCRVFEVSIAAAYMATMNLDDPVQASAYTVAGYQKNNPLTQVENDLVYYLLQARLYQSICFGTTAALADPENSEYLTYSVKRAWKVLNKFAAISPKEFERKWKELSEPL